MRKRILKFLVRVALAVAKHPDEVTQIVDNAKKVVEKVKEVF